MDLSLLDFDLDCTVFASTHRRLRDAFDSHYFASIPFRLEEECRSVLHLLSRQSVFVVDQDQAARCRVTPRPQDKIEIIVGCGGCVALYDQPAIAVGGKLTREGLRSRLSGRLHLITPGMICERRRIDALRLNGRVFPTVEYTFEIGIIGDQRRRLQIADLIGFFERRHDRQRCVKGRHAFRVKPASV